MRVALFATCMNDALYGSTSLAVTRVLEKLGHEVVFPRDQTCCGQLHLNAGYRSEGLRLAERFVKVFGSYEVIVSPSASCVGTVRELYASSAAAAGNERFASELGEVSQRVYEFSEFLVEVLHVSDVGASFPHKVAYHPTCHSLRVLGLRNTPRVLLEHVRNLKLVDVPRSDECCGFGGMFSMKNSDTSVAIGLDKLTDIRCTDAEVVCALDNSCLAHIGGIASRNRSGLRFMHLAEIIAHDEESSSG